MQFNFKINEDGLYELEFVDFNGDGYEYVMGPSGQIISVHMLRVDVMSEEDLEEGLSELEKLANTDEEE